MNNEDVLNLPMKDNDSGTNTIRGYLKALLLELWQKGEGFSGKRPFGSSCWEIDLYEPLITANLIEGEFDSAGYVEKCDNKSAHEIIKNAILSL